jgi:hypothetical protein
MQGLFGRFGKKNPESERFTPNYQPQRTRSQVEIDDREYSSAGRFDDEEETNWDDAETLDNENNPILQPQQIGSTVAAPSSDIIPDPDNWDEALPAATVKNSNSQEVRRGKQPVASVAGSGEEDIWDEDLPKSTISISVDPNSRQSSVDLVGQAIGLWTATIHQFRRILPGSLRQLSDPILTAIVIGFVTVAIWVVDSFALPGVDPTVATEPAPAVATRSHSAEIAPKINPDLAFITAIQTQLSDITSQYPDKIVRGLQVDVATDRLIVQLAPAWYTLDESSQNDLTDRMWLQAKANHFTKLEIQDADGKSIARSPVVGREMIILQRRQA